jgi:hypothetical protein
MPRHEVAAMNEVPLDRLGPPLFDGERLRHVVTGLAIRGSVTRPAERAVRRGRSPVISDEIALVSRERARQEMREITTRVARRAFPPVPLCLVLVTAEALLHRRDVRRVLLNDSRMARHALPSDAGESEVTVVIERDFAVGPLRDTREDLPRLALFVRVTPVAQRCVGELVDAIFAARSVASVAAQALGLSGAAASESGEVRLVGEAGRDVLGAGGEDRRKTHRDRERYTETGKPDRIVHRPPPLREPSNEYSSRT